MLGARQLSMTVELSACPSFPDPLISKRLEIPNSRAQLGGVSVDAFGLYILLFFAAQSLVHGEYLGLFSIFHIYASATRIQVIHWFCSILA
jgi:hypothetical protein